MIIKVLEFRDQDNKRVSSFDDCYAVNIKSDNNEDIYLKEEFLSRGFYQIEIGDLFLRSITLSKVQALENEDYK